MYFYLFDKNSQLLTSHDGGKKIKRTVQYRKDRDR